MLRRIVLVIAAVLAVVGSVGIGTASAAPQAVLGGGSGILVADPTGKGKFDCTLAGIGTDAGGRLVGLTAGHCGLPGDLIGAEYLPAAGAVGRIDSAVNVKNGLDYAVILFDRNRVVPVNSVGGLTITGVGDPAPLGGLMCKGGRTTGTTCGISYGDIFGTDRTYSQICVVQGDSGGPVVLGTTLVGIVSAYLQVPCIGPAVGTNIKTILADIDARGGVGTGFVPIP